MRRINLFSILIICLIAFYRCSSPNAKPENSQGQNRISTTNNDLEKAESSNSVFQKNAVLGSIHWNITDDGFQKLLSEWEGHLKENGFVKIAGITVLDGDVKPKFDKNGHLIEISIEFSKFSIHPESDYTDEEKQQLEKLYKEHNQKIGHLIDIVSERYGQPTSNLFDESSKSLYLSDLKSQIAKWTDAETWVTLNVENKTFPGETGCETKMWLDLKENHK